MSPLPPSPFLNSTACPVPVASAAASPQPPSLAAAVIFAEPTPNEGRSDGAPALDAPPNSTNDAGATDLICEIFAGAAKLDDRRFDAEFDAHAFLDAIQVGTGFHGDISWRLERRA